MEICDFGTVLYPFTMINKVLYSGAFFHFSFLWLLGFRRPMAAKTLAGSSEDDQSASRFSGKMKLFPDLGLCICESMNKISLLIPFLVFRNSRFKTEWDCRVVTSLGE